MFLTGINIFTGIYLVVSGEVMNDKKCQDSAIIMSYYTTIGAINGRKVKFVFNMVMPIQ